MCNLKEQMEDNEFEGFDNFEIEEGSSYDPAEEGTSDLTDEELFDLLRANGEIDDADEPLENEDDSSFDDFEADGEPSDSEMNDGIDNFLEEDDEFEGFDSFVEDGQTENEEDELLDF